MSQSTVFVTGIGTGVGKTMVSAVLCAGLRAIYWKPIQAGTEPQTDTQWVEQHTGLSSEFFLPEYKILQAPMSPHAAAASEGFEIQISELVVPQELKHPLVIEGAGGVLVPINNHQVYADLLIQWKIPVVVVVQHYLGSINHSLLTLETLANRSIPVKGIIFNGQENKSSAEVVASYSGERILGHIPFCEYPTQAWISTAMEKYLDWDK
jgi:dethiobiotin synthetase